MGGVYSAISTLKMERLCFSEA